MRRAVWMPGLMLAALTAHAGDAVHESTRVLSRAEFLPAALRLLRGTVAVSAGAITFDGNSAENLELEIDLHERRIARADGSADFAGGQVRFAYTHDVRSRQGHVHLTANAIDTGRIAPAAGVAGVPVDVIADLRGAGASIAEFAARATGAVSVTAGRGTLHDARVARAGSDVLSLLVTGLNPFSDRRSSLPITCARADLHFLNGVVEAPRLARMQTAGFVMTCGGRLDFEHENADLACVPQRDRERLLAAPAVVDRIAITGAFADPVVTVEKAGLLRQGVSLGAGLTGLPLPGFGGEERRVEECRLGPP